MKTKHTPGPWFFSQDERCIYAKLQTVAGTFVEPLIAQCSKHTTSAQANAALIAAAPEMLDALVVVLEILNDCKDIQQKSSEVRDMILQLEDVIKKAKGDL